MCIRDRTRGVASIFCGLLTSLLLGLSDPRCGIDAQLLQVPLQQVVPLPPGLRPQFLLPPGVILPEIRVIPQVIVTESDLLGQPLLQQVLGWLREKEKEKQ